MADAAAVVGGRAWRVLGAPAGRHSDTRLDGHVAQLRGHQANLAAANQAQTILVETAQAVARVQYGYVEQAAADVRAALATKQLPKPAAVMADVKTAAEKAIAVAKEVVDLTVGAQKRVAELVTQRIQASVTDLKALTA